MKNKILSIAIIFIILSFIFINNNVFAVTYDLSDYENYVDGKNWVICYDIEEDKFVLITTSSKYLYGNSIMQDEEGKYYISYSTLSSDYLDTDPWGLPGQISIYNFDYTTSTFNFSSNTSQLEHKNDYYIIACNCTIYNATDNSIFFPPTPIPLVENIRQMVLVKKLEEVEMMEPTMREILTLAPIMIILIASYLGLRKGLTLLKTLRKM